MRGAAKAPACAVAVVFALLGCLLAPVPAHAQHRETRIAPLDRDGEFRIWNLSGSVHVIGWDKDSVQVEADLDDVARDAFLFGASGAGGKLTTDRGGRSGVARLTVRVPRGASVWIKTMSASVVVNGVTGAIDAYAVTGNVHIASPSAASVYAESLGGRVHVTGRAQVVRLRTGGGSVEFSGQAPDLAVRTVSGSVFARVGGLQRGLVESVGGRVHLGVSLRSGGTLEVLTHDGAVDLTLPAAVSARFLLRTVSGALRLDRAFARAAGRVDRDAGFETRGADADVQVRTFSGEIRLRGAAER